MGQFSIAIDEWCKKANKDVDKAARAITIKLFTKVIKRTPVDTGRARGNWQLGYDQMPSGTVSFTGTPDIKSTLGERPVAGHVVYLVNNLPYIGVLEYGGFPNPPKSGTKTSSGYSKQAPSGMVRVSIMEINQAVAEGIAEAKRGR